MPSKSNCATLCDGEGNPIRRGFPREGKISHRAEDTHRTEKGEEKRRSKWSLLKVLKGSTLL